MAINAPDIIAELLQMQEDHVRHELLRFSNAERASIMRVLSPNRRLTHYDDRLHDMSELSAVAVSLL